MTWREIAGDQNLRLANELLTRQGQVNDLRSWGEDVVELLIERQQAYHRDWDHGWKSWRQCQHASCIEVVEAIDRRPA